MPSPINYSPEEITEIMESINKSAFLIDHYFNDPSIYLRHTEEDVIDFISIEAANIQVRLSQIKFILRKKRKSTHAKRSKNGASK
jgi:hypothetical protein